MEKHEIVSLLAPIGKPDMAVDWDGYSALGFTSDDAPILVDLAVDDSFFDAEEGTPEYWVPLHAWRSLRPLMPAGLEQLIGVLDLLAEDEWAMNEMPQVLSAAGEAALAPLTAVWQNTESHEYARSMAIETLSKIGATQQELRTPVIEILTAALRSKDQDDFLNGIIVAGLLDLKAAESIEDIRAAYEDELVDWSISGDMEDVEIALGLREKRDTPRPHYLAAKNPGLLEFLQERESTFSRWEQVTPVEQVVRTEPKVGRNDPCPCGSGKKYKKCCMP